MIMCTYAVNYPSGKDDNFFIGTLQSSIALWQSISGSFFAVFVMVISISAAGNCFVIMNATPASVTQRTREIGVRRAVVLYEVRYLSHLPAESLLQCLIGGASASRSVSAARWRCGDLHLVPGSRGWSGADRECSSTRITQVFTEAGNEVRSRNATAQPKPMAMPMAPPMRHCSRLSARNAAKYRTSWRPPRGARRSRGYAA